MLSVLLPGTCSPTLRTCIHVKVLSLRLKAGQGVERVCLSRFGKVEMLGGWPSKKTEVGHLHPVSLWVIHQLLHIWQHGE